MRIVFLLVDFQFFYKQRLEVKVLCENKFRLHSYSTPCADSYNFRVKIVRVTKFSSCAVCSHTLQFQKCLRKPVSRSKRKVGVLTIVQVLSAWTVQGVEFSCLLHQGRNFKVCQYFLLKGVQKYLKAVKIFLLINIVFQFHHVPCSFFVQFPVLAGKIK